MQGVGFRSLLGVVVKPGLVSSFPALIIGACLLLPADTFAQSVVSDGGSATTVSIAPSGQITVGIAPADAASISHNTYSDFSVPASGVNLDNSVVSAGTILNEVTSAKVTTIEGELKVLGNKADVIIANPNGITVNGGRFVNTRNLALTTGVLGRDASDRITASIDRGEIAIGTGGLSGTMEELALISRALKVDGPIAHDTVDASSLVNIISGDSKVSFNQSHVSGASLPWAKATDGGTKSSNSVLVDITQHGSVNSGRIRIAVSDAGAGVRFAGDQLASSGGFRLNTDGQIELKDAQIEASGSVTIRAASAKLTSSETKRAEIVSDGGAVTIELGSGDLELGSAKISGATSLAGSTASSGGVTLLVAGKITSKGEPRGQVAELVSTGSSISATAGAGIEFDGLSVDAFESFFLETVGADSAIRFNNATGSVGDEFNILTDAPLSFSATKFDVEDDIRLIASSMQFGTKSKDEGRTELIAKKGGFVAKTSVGDIQNYGSLLQGNTVENRYEDSLGALTLESAAGIMNESLSVDRLAVVFGQSGDLHITAAEDIVNRTARFFSRAAITIATAGDILNETAIVGKITPYSIQSFKGGRFASSLFLKRSRKLSAFANYGRRAVAGEQAFILGIGDLALQAANIHNAGANITGATVRIDATEKFSNESRQTGYLLYSQSCKFFCKTTGFSNLAPVGGNVTASNQVIVSAGKSVASIAGRIDGARGVVITAPVTRFVPLLTASFIEQRAGASGLFGGRSGLLSMGYQFGLLRSPAGKITINGDVELGETAVVSGEALEVTGSTIKSKEFPDQIVIGKRPIGIFWNLF